MGDGQLRLAVLGLTHDHIWHHTEDLAGSSAVRVVGVADENEELLEQFRGAVPTEMATTDARALLEEAAPDVAMIYADNRGSAALACEALERGVNVIVEKPMAASLGDAEAMLAAASRGGAELMVNWPTAWHPPVQHALALARDGAIGRVTHVEYRAAHVGPKEFGCSPYFYGWLYDAERNGGGALVDYCSYGALLARVLIGMPQRVFAAGGRFQKRDIDVEDNAILTMSYPAATAVAQASWSQIGGGTGLNPVFYGTEGSLIVHQRPGAREGHVVKEGQIELMTLDDPGGTLVEPPPLPAGRRNAIEHFAAHLLDGAPLDPLVEPATGRDVQEILDAGYASLRSGEAIEVSRG
jgi:predicted dehydrogenase